MKKVITVTIVILIVAMCLASFSACNFFNSAKWQYSEDGATELNMNFAALTADEVTGVFKWIVDRSDDTAYTMTTYVDKKSETEEKIKYVYEKEDETLIMISVDGTTTYINETEKTVSSSSSQDFFDVGMELMFIGMCGMIKLTDEEKVYWTLVEKTESASILNSTGMREDMVEYEYARGADNQLPEGTKLFVDFKKVLTPVIGRIYYEYYDGETLTSSAIIYMPLQTAVAVTDADFEIPDETDGYTVS